MRARDHDFDPAEFYARDERAYVAAVAERSGTPLLPPPPARTNAPDEEGLT